MIDYEYWDSINEFTINEAAWLWIGEEPKFSHSERTGKYVRTANLIYDATKIGELSFRETTLKLNGVYGDGETYVTRDDLKNFALSIGQKPKFLFPEMRLDSASQADQAPNTNAINENGNGELKSKKELEKLLSIIGLLAETLADSNPGDFRNKSGAVVVGDGELSREGETDMVLEILQKLETLNLSKKYGLGKSTLQKAISDGLKVLHDKK